MELKDYLEKVEDQKPFLRFVKALQAGKVNEVAKEIKNHPNPYSHGWNKRIIRGRINS